MDSAHIQPSERAFREPPVSPWYMTPWSSSLSNWKNKILAEACLPIARLRRHTDMRRGDPCVCLRVKIHVPSTPVRVDSRKDCLRQQEDPTVCGIGTGLRRGHSHQEASALSSRGSPANPQKSIPRKKAFIFFSSASFKGW